MRDNFGDLIEVWVQESTGSVYLDVHEGETRAQASLTPKKARRLARALKRAAKEAS